MKRKILIIGSAGFIGSHLVNFFANNGFEVIKADILPGKEQNYHQVNKDNPDFHSIFKSCRPDFCLNCSGAASVPFSFEQPLLDFKLNVHNVVKMLDAIKQCCPECRFVNFSSAAVYGNPKSIPINETFEKQPISPYGYHKSMVEDVLNEYHQYFKLKTCTLRLFSAYGDGLKKQIMFDLYNKFTKNEKVELFGTGKETRDYIHIDDICHVVKLIMNKSDFNNDIINVANGVEVELNTIANIYRDYLKSDKEIVYSGNVRNGDPSRWQADISKLRSWGYVQTKTLNEGIKDYIEWVKKE